VVFISVCCYNDSMMKLLALFLALFFSVNTFSQIEGVYTVVIKKQEEKKASRWSLADWLMTKKRIALMDQWLALHSSSNWFEFIFDYSFGDIDESINNTSQTYAAKKYGAAIYLRFFGVEIEKMSDDYLTDQTSWKLNLIALGSSVQSTHLRFFYGKRDYNYTGFSDYSQELIGPHLSLYLFDFLGGEVTYTKFYKKRSASGDYTMDGQRVEYGPFIDLRFLRIYLNLFKESTYFRNVTTTKKVNEGILTGAKLFF